MVTGRAHQSYQRHWGTGPRSTEELAEALDRRNELEWVGGESAEAVMAVESRGLVILGVDHQGEDGDLGAYGAHRRVEKDRGPEFAALEAPVDGKPPDAGRRYRGVTGQPACYLGGTVGNRNIFLELRNTRKARKARKG